MKRTTKTRKPRIPRTPSEAQLAALRDSTNARREATVERLRAAIEALKTKKQDITAQTIYDECGLRYAAIHRNPEALALFRANSTHLNAQKNRAKRKRNSGDDTAPLPRDPLLNYKKPQLVARLRTSQQQLLALQQQQSVLVEAMVEREDRVAQLEARLAELEPYRAFVEQVRSRVRQEEHGNTGDLSPNA